MAATFRTLNSLAAALLTLVLVGCTGGSESNAAVEPDPAEPAVSSQAEGRPADARRELNSISGAIPVYQGALYREDLTRRDEAMVRNKYGPEAEVFTLATDDSYPQVYHYYMTYLAQFRAFPAQNPYPRQNDTWRAREVNLNEAMQDPFVPGQAMDPEGRQVILQIAETEARPRTVIRYIVIPAPPAPVTTAAAEPDPAQVAR